MILDREELCQALGISDTTISMWEKKGLPTVRKGRGRGQRSLYDYDVVRAWCRKTGLGATVQAFIARERRAAREAAVSAAAPGSSVGVQAEGALTPRELAQAMSMARVACFTSEATAGCAAAPQEAADIVGAFMLFLAEELEAAVGIELQPILEECQSPDAWPATWPEIIERAKREVPEPERMIQ